jgi:hypothetical protein
MMYQTQRERFHSQADKDASLSKARLLGLPIEDRPDHLQTTWQIQDKGLEALQ